MIQQLGYLIDLQNLDTKIGNIESENEVTETGTKNLESEFKERKAQFDNLHKEYLKKELELKESNAKITENGEKYKKLRNQRLQLTKPKEVDAIDREMLAIKKEISSLEDDTLKLMEEVETLKKKFEENQTKITEEESKILDKKGEDKSRVESTKQELESLKEKRRNIAKDIEPQLLERYEIIRAKKFGVGLVAINDSSCSGCNIELPPQTVSEIMGNNSIIFCPNCIRILYSDKF